MCENIFAHRLLQPLMIMLECTCKYLVNTGQRALRLCLPCYPPYLTTYSASVVARRGGCYQSPTKLQLRQCISYLWISTVEFFPPVVILQISHCYCALIWPITARTRRSVSQVLIDRHLCLSNAGSSRASQMIFFFPIK